MNHIHTLRAIVARAAELNHNPPVRPVDADLNAEAGMGWAYIARLLQAARDLDNTADTQEEQDTTR